MITTKVDLYRKKHEGKSMYGRGATFMLSQIALFIEYLNPKSILDYGCGKGDLVKALRIQYPNIEVAGYDPAVSEYSVFPSREFDFVVCTDVLEHIPKDELPNVVKKISLISPNVFFHLHHAIAGEILDNGENAHCTIEPPVWYHALLREYFEFIQPMDGYFPVNTACLTFEVPAEIEVAYEKAIVEFSHKQMKIMEARLKKAASLLKCDYRKDLPGNTIFYGYSKICKIVLSKIKDRKNVVCVLDRNASLSSEGGAVCA